MREPDSSSLTSVNIGEIDFEDRTYALSPEWLRSVQLQRSIQAVGLLVPLRLEKVAVSKLRIISGFRRFKIARDLGIEEIPCMIVPLKPPRETFVEALWENVGCRTLSEIEKAIALAKLRRPFGFSESEIIRDFLPLLGLRADRYHYDRYLSLARLPENIQRAVTEKGLSTETALRLSGWGREELGLFSDLVDRYRLGKNKQKEFFELLGELRAIMQAQAHDVWELCGAKEIDENRELSPQDRIHRIKSVLRKRRYPHLTEYEERYRKLRKSLGLPAGVKLDMPPYFEGSCLAVTIEASSARALRDLIHTSGRLFDRDELDQIFKLL